MVNINRGLLLAFAFIFGIFVIANSSAAGYSSSYMNYQPSYQSYYGSGDISTYWPIIGDKTTCQARQDVVLQIAPGGCTPSVVRSDLIAEQNVPVFCQVQALQLNPLVDIKRIRNIVFSGKYPAGVYGAAFHPANAALNTRNSLLGNPISNNIGYVVLILKKNANESSLPESIITNLTARIEYEAGNAFGIGNYQFNLQEMSDQDWNNIENRQTFFQGRYSLRLERAESDYAIVSIYQGDIKVNTVKISKNGIGSSNENKIYLPGYYCQAALTFSYDQLTAAAPRARIEVGDNNGRETFDVYQGSSFLDGKCSVRSLQVNPDGRTGKVDIRCDYNNPLTLEKRAIGFALNEKVNYTEGSVYRNAVITNASNAPNYEIVLESDGTKLIVSEDKLKHVYSKVASSKSNVVSDSDEAFYEAIDAYKQVAEDYTNEKEKEADRLPIGENALLKAAELAKDKGQSEVQKEIYELLIEKYPESVDINIYKQTIDQLNRFDSSLGAGSVYLDNGYKTINLVGIYSPTKQPKANLNFNKLDSNGRSVSFRNNVDVEYNKESTLSFDDDSIKSVKLVSIDTNGARLEFKCKNDRTSTASVRLDNSYSSLFSTGTTRTSDSVEVSVCSTRLSITVNNLDVERAARIRVTSSADNARIETNLTVGIGIEKRAIKLTPEKTKDKVSNLNDSIKKWDSISNNLGKAVTGLKAACLATSTFIVAKNFFTGLDGAALARQKVMDEGWRDYCKSEVSKKTYTNVDECYAKNSAQINNDIKLVKDRIAADNAKIKSYSSSSENQKSTVFGGTRADSDKVGSLYVTNDMNSALAKIPSAERTKVSQIVKDSGKSIDDKLFSSGLSGTDYSNGSITQQQAMRISIYSDILSGSGSEVTKEKARQDLAKELSSVQERKQENEVRNSVIENAGKLSLGTPFIASDKNSKKGEWSGSYVSNLPESIKSKMNNEASTNRVQYVYYSGREYLVTLDEKLATDGSYPVKNVYNVDGTLNEAAKSGIIRTYPSFNKVDATSYINKYNSPVIIYYETEPYKGVPEVVPINVNEGWYAGIQNDLGVFGAKKSVDSNGAVQSFWLCNVGKNGNQEFEKEGFGDDHCKRIDFYTGQVVGEFSGLAKSKVDRLVQDAINAIKDAQRGYSNGVKKVNILGQSTNVGNPASLVSGAACAEFMSTSDCNIIFNVCDPVVCPSSRCNLGGQFTVPDVIQSGIVGSAVLCLPNFGNPSEGKVAIPVCLSGLKAGIDGYVSVLKAHRDCLQNSLDTGEMRGICDQLYSVYMCDFFWKQIAPAVNVLIPKIVEAAYGQGQSTRGGGEYMSVMFAWENAKKSVDYFTQTYAINTFKAFQARSVEDVGSEFCKSFISTASPGSIKTLLEPDSPPQFYASFTETSYSGATVPASSQYKVFYHIFGGKDSGVYYSVYLKNPPSLSYYQSASSIAVASGFIAKGQYADETKDFTAPEGYKELCVRINNEEKCGFKQVTTDFGLNYLKDSIVSSQINESDIKTSEQCVSGAGLTTGDLNSAALLNTNLQSGAQEAVSSKIYERGIVRVCATENPASSTNPSRYVAVGYCGDERVKCWLDKNSVNNAIENGDTGIKNATLQSLEATNKAYLSNTGQLMSLSSVYKNVQDVKNAIKGDNGLIKQLSSLSDPSRISGQLRDNISNVIKIIDDNVAGETSEDSITVNNEAILLNSQKAQLLSLKGELKDAIARVYFKQAIQSKTSSVKVNNRTLTIENLSNNPSSSNDSSSIPTVINSDDRANEFSGYGLETGTMTIDGVTKAADYISLSGKIIPIVLVDNNVYIYQSGNDSVIFSQLKPLLVGSYSSTGNVQIDLDLVNKSLTDGSILSINSDFMKHLTNLNGYKYSELKKYVDVSKEKYTLDLAITEARKRTGSYSDNKLFIDSLYADAILTDKEYNEINGEGLFNLEEDMTFVLDLLNKKKNGVTPSGEVKTGYYLEDFGDHQSYDIAKDGRTTGIVLTRSGFVKIPLSSTPNIGTIAGNGLINILKLDICEKQNVLADCKAINGKTVNFDNLEIK